MRFLRRLLFVLGARLRLRSRIAMTVYLKGTEKIRLGRKCKIHDCASIDATRSPGIVIGDGVTLNRYAYLQGGQGGITLGDRVEINNFTIVNGTGGVVIGNDTLIGPGVKIISYQHEYRAGQKIREQATVGKPIRIGQDVWIGSNAVIMAGVNVGDGAVIAAGAVVNRDVPANVMAAGVPAAVKKMRT